MGILKLFTSTLSASRIPNLLIIGVAQWLSANMILRQGLIETYGFHLILLIVSTMMVAAGGYIINDYYDSKIDMVNRPTKVVVGISLSRRMAIAMHLLISTSSVLIGFYISIKIGLIHCFSVTLLWWFSNHLRRYFLGKITIAALTATSILAVAMMYEVVSYPLLTFAAFGAAIIWIRELIKDMENAQGERAFGVESIPEVWGFRGTKMLIGIIAIFSTCLLIYLLYRVNSYFLSLYYLSLFPVFVVFGVMLFRADTKKHFTQIRKFSNLLILAGLLSMLFI